MYLQKKDLVDCDHEGKRKSGGGKNKVCSTMLLKTNVEKMSIFGLSTMCMKISNLWPPLHDVKQNKGEARFTRGREAKRPALAMEPVPRQNLRRLASREPAVATELSGAKREGFGKVVASGEVTEKQGGYAFLLQFVLKFNSLKYKVLRDF